MATGALDLANKNARLLILAESNRAWELAMSKQHTGHELNPRERRWHALAESGWLGSLKLQQLRTMIAIVRHLDAGGKCWPGTRRISDLSGVRDDFVTKAIRELEGLGLFRVERGGGRGKRTEFYIDDEVLRNGPPIDFGSKKSGTNPPETLGEQPKNSGPNSPSTLAKPSKKTGSVSHQVKSKRKKTRKSKIETIDFCVSFQDQHPGDIEIACDELGLSRRVRDLAEARCRGATVAALATTRLRMQDKKIRNPAAYLTDLLKRIAVEGSDAITGDLDEALDNLGNVIDARLSIAENTKDPIIQWIDRLDKLRKFVRRHATGELKNTTLKLIDGNGCFDRPELAAAWAVEHLRSDPVLVSAGILRFSKEINSLLDVE